LATRSQQRTHFARCGDNRRPPCAHLAMRACRRTRPASGMAETLCARLPIPGVRSPGVNNFRAGPGASQIASASTYAASGATERPRTSGRRGLLAVGCRLWTESRRLDRLRAISGSDQLRQCVALCPRSHGPLPCFRRQESSQQRFAAHAELACQVADRRRRREEKLAGGRRLR
jgi:hypothetical protein